MAAQDSAQPPPVPARQWRDERSQTGCGPSSVARLCQTPRKQLSLGQSMNWQHGPPREDRPGKGLTWPWIRGECSRREDEGFSLERVAPGPGVLLLTRHCHSSPWRCSPDPKLGIRERSSVACRSGLFCGWRSGLF